MKSTLKVDFAANGMPIIKIIRPNEVCNLSEFDDYDVRDRLLNDFIQLPLNAGKNELFQTYFHETLENGAVLTTIAPIKEMHLFDTFKHHILRKIIPHEHLVAIHRGYAPSEETIKAVKEHRQPISIKDTHYFRYLEVVSFFDRIKEMGGCTWAEQQPLVGTKNAEENTFLATPRTRRDYFELELEQEWRIKAFESTPVGKLDEIVANFDEAMEYVPNWRNEMIGTSK